MGFFERTFKKEEKNAAPKREPRAPAQAKAAPAAASVTVSVRDVLIRPRITEKAANLTGRNVYVFDVRTDATKREVADAVRAIYKVVPVKVHVVNVAGKRVAMRRKRGFGKTASSRKAYVYLKQGSEIQFA